MEREADHGKNTTSNFYFCFVSDVHIKRFFGFGDGKGIWRNAPHFIKLRYNFTFQIIVIVASR
jgi:hypothetical protein